MVPEKEHGSGFRTGSCPETFLVMVIRPGFRVPGSPPGILQPFSMLFSSHRSNFWRRSYIRLRFFLPICKSPLVSEHSTGSTGTFIKPDFSFYFSGHPEKSVFPDTNHY